MRRPVVGGIAGLAVLAAVGGAVAVGALPGRGLLGLSAAGATGSPSTSSPAVATTTVERRTMRATEELSGTLGYEGELAVRSASSGILTWLPSPGTVVKRGERLFELDGRRRPRLFLGTRPMWRSLRAGVSDGLDVRQIEANLKALGYAPKGMKVDRHWDARTTAAVKRWEKATGQARDGVIEIGDVIVLPSAIRVRETTAEIGTAVGPGGPILAATRAAKVVTVRLDAAKRGRLAVGDAVSIVLPDDTKVAGTVRSIGRVANVDDQGGATVTVTVTLDTPSAVPDLDQAPVTVHVTTEAHEDVLAVPVEAILALREGGYAVEVVDASGARRYVAVTLGLFEDGMVEISGSGLSAGDRVVVPS